MRYLIVTIALALLAGCATTSTAAGDKPRVFYDRKYNTYSPLRSDARDVKAPGSAPYFDHKYNTHSPVRGGSGDRS